MRTLLNHLDGPAPTLPRRLDDVARAWAGWPPRVRWAVRALGILLVLVGPGLRTATSPWGAAIDVALVVRDLPAGSIVSADDVRPARWPATLAADALTVDQVVGQRLRHGLVAGAIARPGNVASGGLGSLVPDGLAAVAVATEDAPQLHVGDHVDVHPPDLATIRDGVVVAIDGDHVWIALPRRAAGAVAVAAGRGPVGVSLVPPPVQSAGPPG